MRILFESIANAPNVNSNEFIDIQGLSFHLPNEIIWQRRALITLNVPRPYAEGNNFPGLDFAITVDGVVKAEGGFTYPMKQPESFARVPFTLVLSVDLGKEPKKVHAQWKSVRGSVGYIDSFASLSAVVD